MTLTLLCQSGNETEGEIKNDKFTIFYRKLFVQTYIKSMIRRMDAKFGCRQICPTNYEIFHLTAENDDVRPL